MVNPTHPTVQPAYRFHQFDLRRAGAAGVAGPAGCLAGPAASWLDPPEDLDIWMGEDRPPQTCPPIHLLRIQEGDIPAQGSPVPDTPPPYRRPHLPYWEHPSQLGHPSNPSSHPRKLSESLHLGISVDFIFHNISYFSKKPLYFEKHPFYKYRKNTALRKYLFLGYL